MFTVKICNPDATQYIQGEAVHTQSVQNALLVRVSTEPNYRDVLIPDLGAEMDSPDLMGERVYIMNEKGKTIDSVHQRVPR